MKKILSSLVILTLTFTNIYAQWTHDNLSDLTISDVVPEPSTEADLTTESNLQTKEDGWTTNLTSDETVQHISSSNFKGLIAGNSYGAYTIEKLYKKKNVKRFYQNRGNTYFWFKNGFKITSQIKSLISAIERAPDEALDDLKRYHKNEIDIFLTQIDDDSYENSDKKLLFANFDILLTDAFLTLANDLYSGTLNYTKLQQKLKTRSANTDIDYKWSMKKDQKDYNNLLITLHSSQNIEAGLYQLVNHSMVYNRLKDAYHKYKDIVANGGWGKIPRGKVIRYGSKGKRVDMLAKRLSLSGDLANYNPPYTKFNKTLKTALISYQKRMGLWTSGRLTPKTRKSLNISARAKLMLIKLNLNKSRWESASMNGQFIFVNIPDFMLRFFDGDAAVLTSRVIVGKKKNPTPIFSSSMSYVVLNPTWTVPNSIVVNEMLPKLKEDPGYLSPAEFDIFNGWGKDRTALDPYSIDWHQYNKNSKVPFAFVRKSGKSNPLGVVKFMFPNNNAVYIHDTPSKHLFKKRIRAYSHGCIRLHNPKNLLEFLSDSYMSSGYTTVKNKLKKGKLKSLPLNQNIPVYIRYYTVFVTDDGTVKFAHDIYGYDKTLLKLDS